MSDLIVALDFGGTKLSAALTTLANLKSTAPTWRDRQRHFSPPDADAQYEIRTMLAMSKALLAGKRPIAVGVSFGGPLDFESGTVRLSHHVSGWENMPLKEIVQAEFGAPALVDNDANAAALGEHRFGSGRGYNDLMYVTVSTGVGGGWILNGRPWRGHESMAGEIGHTVVDPGGPLCLCGKRGCVERLASGRFMAQDLEEAWRRQPSALAERFMEGKEITGETVAKAAAAGEEKALGILERGAWALGVGIGNAANLIGPQVVLLGGGVTRSGERWWSTVRRVARETALPEVQYEIMPAALADDAPLWGAAALAVSASR